MQHLISLLTKVNRATCCCCVHLAELEYYHRNTSTHSVWFGMTVVYHFVIGSDSRFVATKQVRRRTMIERMPLRLTTKVCSLIRCKRSCRSVNCVARVDLSPFLRSNVDVETMFRINLIRRCIVRFWLIHNRCIFPLIINFIYPCSMALESMFQQYCARAQVRNRTSINLEK